MEHHHLLSRAAGATCKLNMVFHAGHCERILWTWWVASEVWEFVLSCFAMAALAFAIEAIKHWRYLLNEKECRRLAQLREAEPRTATSANDCCHSELDALFDDERTFCERVSTRANVVQSLLYFVQMCVSYCVMLAFMNYNYWLCLAIVVGLCLGHLFFGHTKLEAYLKEQCACD